ncbi:hypothetical protein [Polaribacter cellanae]|uniref:Auto-transporter adhesin head GIN domain-containing protein n=1 Tax=Polaribacter cellanae TaxID=2818493 RepID=A0A975CPA1_9FLAO|nr:hypothetical protein [Polaribacter cellanae]QTE23193.1 hypothetical protein J3359_02640 [Polaribacter cellanae]
MKNFKSIIAIIAISLSTVFSATANNVDPKTNKETKTLRTEMFGFIGKNISVEIKKTTTAEVLFIINNKDEVVVLSVNSKNPELNSFLKNKLNYKKIVTKNVIKGKIYKMPLKVKSK